MHWSVHNMQSNDCASITSVVRKVEEESIKELISTGTRASSFPEKEPIPVANDNPTVYACSD